MPRRRPYPLHIVGVVASGADPIASYERAYDYPEIAAELWHLQGRDDRAAAIRALLSRAFTREPPHLTSNEVRELLALVEDLEAYTVAHLTDARWRITMDQVAELRPRATYLELEESRGQDATAAVAEALIDVGNLVTILRHAIEFDAEIAFD